MEKGTIKKGLIIGGLFFATWYLTRKQKPGTGQKTNAQHLDTLNPKYKPVFVSFINELTRKGLKPVINSSKRSKLKQVVIKSKNPKAASPGTSKHTSAAAIDLQVWYNGKLLGNKSTRAEWLASGAPQIAAKYGLTWGGNFKNYFDAVHFQI